MNTRELGRLGEEAALRYLQERGYRLIARNFHCPYGELDLIMQQGRQLVFVEVKARTSNRFGQPEDAIGRQKMRRLRQAIGIYLQQEAPAIKGCAWMRLPLNWNPIPIESWILGITRILADPFQLV